MKIYKLFALIVLVLFTIHATAQDTIYKTDGSIVLAKVMEVNGSSIKYKVNGNTNQSVVENNKSDIRYIAYKNGLKEYYNSTAQKRESPAVTYKKEDQEMEAKRDYKNELPKKNIVALNCFDMLFVNLSMSYERISESGKYSIKIPLSCGLGGPPNTTDYNSTIGTTQFLQNKIYSGGLEFNVYPFGQTKSTFYLGIGGVAGSFYYYKDGSVPNYYGYSYYQNRYIGSHYAVLFHLGGYLRLSDHFSIGAKAAIGLKREDTIVEDYTLPTAEMDFNIAYKF